MHFEVIKYLSHLVCAFNKVKGMMKFMNEYDSKYWKPGSSITVEQFCSYVMHQIPKDAVFYVCGSSSISLHFSPDGNIFSVDCNSLGTVNKLILTIGFDFIIPFSQLFIRKKIDLGKFLIRYFSSSLINIVVYNTIDF